MDDYIKKYLTVLALFVVLPSSSMAAPLWSDVATQAASNLEAKQLAPNPHEKSRRVSVDYVQLKSVLASANALSAGQAAKSLVTAQIELPMPDGNQQIFNVVESSIMEPELAAKFPEIKTYKVTLENDPTVTGVVDVGPNGFHAYLFTANGEVLIDPVPASDLQEYYSYNKRDYASIAAREFSCGVKAQSEIESPVAEFKNADVLTAARTSGDKISYRIAVAATAEYTQEVGGGNVANTQAAIVTAIARVNEIYERDLAIELLLVDNTEIIHDLSTDPYTDQANPSLLIEENQTRLDSVVGSLNYDLGHVFSTNPGGLAALGVACYSGYKAQGVSGLASPLEDPFYIDFVAHEIGHQLGANHSFNGTTKSCVNRNAATAFEPGSGSTIMAYAGLCGTEDVATLTDATFHAGSIAEIIDYTRLGTGNTCSVNVNTQQAPTVNAGQNYTIPGGTPFVLTGLATDPEDDAMKYQWDQMDAGSSTNDATYGTDNGSNALFRSYLPVDTAIRTFPVIDTLLGINPDPLADKAETLPTENRTLNFRLTARDGNGGVDEDDMKVTVDGEAGPFEIIQPNTNVNLNSGLLQLIEWNTACTNAEPINCAYVDILLSTDGGQTYSSVVGGSTLNDGSQPVTLSANTTTARIKIVCTNNIFFDVSDVDFQISGSGGSLTASGIAPACGTATGSGTNTGDDIEPNNYPAQAQSLTFPSTLIGTVNNVEDPDDYFVFVANAMTYTFILSNYGGNDLDLILYDDTGKGVIRESVSEANPTEKISVVLAQGKTYYLAVNGFQTSGNDSSYTLDAKETTSSGGGVASYYWLFMLLITPLLRLSRRGRL